MRGMSDDHPLKAYRKRMGLTLEDLAQQLNTSRSWLSRIENRKEQAGADTIAKLKRATGLSADDFINGAA